MELSVKKILRVLISYIWIIILSAILLGAAGFAYSHYCIPPTYTSSMKLMVTSEDTMNSSSEITTMRRMVNTYVEMLDSRDFYQVIKDACQLKYSPAQLKSMITYTIKEDSEAFTATVVAGSHDECSQIIQCLDDQVQKYVSEKYARLTITSVESPSSPAEHSQTKRNTMLAAILGMILSAVIIVICSEFDVRIKSVDDLSDRYKIPVLGVVPNFELKKNRSKNAKSNHSHREDTIADQEVPLDEKK
ncbi:MAG: hypothetical protein IJN42_02045 [Clostridia bacterium]|nr:hypothetical protein [Clostridia bacterium]